MKKVSQEKVDIILSLILTGVVLGMAILIIIGLLLHWEWVHDLVNYPH